MGECERSSKRTTRVGEEAEATENSSSSASSVSKRTRLTGVGFADELQETASSASPSALPPAADEEAEAVTLNSGVCASEEASSRLRSSNGSGELLDLEEARSFETDGSTSCVANNKLSYNRSRERRITESSEPSGNYPREEMESKSDGEEKQLARVRYDPPPSPAPRRMRTQKPSPTPPSSKVLRLSPAQLETLFGAFERNQCKAFKEKYNFDFVNEVPLEGGRYEWVPLKTHQEGARE